MVGLYFDWGSEKPLTKKQILKEYPDAIIGKYGWFSESGCNLSVMGNKLIEKYYDLLEWEHAGDNVLARISDRKVRDQTQEDIIKKSGVIDFINDSTRMLDILTDLNHHTLCSMLTEISNREVRHVNIEMSC